MNADCFSLVRGGVFVLLVACCIVGCVQEEPAVSDPTPAAIPLTEKEAVPEAAVVVEEDVSEEQEAPGNPEAAEAVEGEADDVAAVETVRVGEMIPVPAGTFKMGRPYEWDPAWGPERTLELPVNEVYLDAYEIGKFQVTNQEYADVLNWALKKGYLQDEHGGPFTSGLIYAYGMPVADTEQSTTWSQITFQHGVFTVRSNLGYNNQEFSMVDHPVVVVNWYGAVAYCNWLSEIQGLQPCYDMATWTRHEPVRNGYRLPTEAEWERAAAWDGEKHWRYGFTSDTLDTTRANYGYETGKFSNPLGINNVPRTSPVGWYNGVNPANLSDPTVLTVDSKSPIGAYDMSGNVWEWCHDWWCRPFTEEPVSNPTGPEQGSYRTLRGCAWFYPGVLCRSAHRTQPKPPDRRSYNYGFRLARTP